MPYVSCTKLDTEVAALQAQIDALSGSSGITAVSHDATLTGDGNTTPLSVTSASDSQKGAVELATTTETVAGTSTTLAVTPAGVAAALAAAAPNLVDSQGNALAVDACVLKCPTTAGTAGQVLTAQADGSTLWTTPSSGGTGGITAVSHDATLSGDGNTTPLSVVSASETQAGAVELATTAEAAAGTSTTLAVTPAGVAAAVPQATDSVAGKVELATTTEAAAGTSTTLAVTPAGVAAAIAATVVQATETVKGIAEIATAAEAQAWANDTNFLTPLKLANAFQGANQNLSAIGYQKLPGGLIIQWGYVIADTTAAAVSFPVAFPTAAYVAVASLANGANDAPPTGEAQTRSLSATQVSFRFTSVSGAAEVIFFIAIGA